MDVFIHQFIKRVFRLLLTPDDSKFILTGFKAGVIICNYYN
jgi:hypothetical protein